MKSLKHIVQKRLLLVTTFMMISLLLIALYFQITAQQSQAMENADATFAQVQQIIRESAEDLANIESEYRSTCLHNAEVISYVIRHNPDIIGDVEQFRELAKKLEVDEIHIFDESGRIFTGTHPEYYDYTFDSGEQMHFFRPMLKDRNLRLCQDITPNTAEGKLVQYSALWSADRKYIVQVGMYPDTVLRQTEKSSLSYIFSLLQGAPGVSLYAIAAADSTIIGATDSEHNYKYASDIGIDLYDIGRFRRGGHCTVNGVRSFCVLSDMNGTIIAYVIENQWLYHNIGAYTVLLTLCVLAIAVVFVAVITRYINRYIIGSIARTNQRLRSVTEGDLDKRVDVQSSQEFSELTSHINTMIRSLLATTDKMSLVLSRTNLHIGVYEYSTKMKHARFTERIAEIFELSPVEVTCLTSDHQELQRFIDRIRETPLQDEENIYRFPGKQEKYVRIEEIHTDNDVLGIAMDVTRETVSRRQAESERDHDLVTGLYNRRGLERRLEPLFTRPKDMAFGALFLLDLDDLKDINDTYGHAVGDSYLKCIADKLESVDAPRSIAARIGGDEYVLLVWSYKSSDGPEAVLQQLRQIQDRPVTLDNGRSFPLRFSFGHVSFSDQSDYTKLLSVADERMYVSKRARKQAGGT